MVQPGLHIGDYVIEEKLGEGGFATVWRAHHKSLGSVAIKVLHQNLLQSSNRVSGPSVIDRFLAEVELLQSLTHPGFVKIHEPVVYLEDNFLGYSMELLHGDNLSAWIPKIPLAPLVLVMAAIADTLENLHKRDVIHRDIKASNIFLNQSQEAGADYYTIKLIDFGIAKQLSESRVLESTAAGYLVGTIGRLPPECFQRWEDKSVMVGTKVDQWCFGVTLFYVLSGLMPFHAESTTDLIDMITRGETRTFRLQSRFSNRHKDSLYEVIMGCLQVKPEDRYASMSVVAKSLRAIAEECLEELHQDSAETTPLSPVRDLSRIKTAPVQTLADETLTRWLRDSEFHLLDQSASSVTLNDESINAADDSFRQTETETRSEFNSTTLRVGKRKRVLVTKFGEAISTDENSQRMEAIQREALQRTVIRPNGYEERPSSHHMTEEVSPVSDDVLGATSSSRPLTADTLRPNDTLISPTSLEREIQSSQNNNAVERSRPVRTAPMERNEADTPKEPDGVATFTIGLLCVLVGFVSYFIVWWLRRNP